jgi:glucan biosynthesis protein C
MVDGESTAVVMTSRRRDLDIARVGVVLGVVVFHSALVFDASDDFYVKNDDTTDVTTWLAALGVVWAMPLLFTVAGVAARHSLARRSALTFVRERLRRLGLPLIAGVVLLAPIAQWYRVKAEDDYSGDYWTFYPRFFDTRVDLTNFPFVVRPATDGDTFETGHLWFLVLLLVFSLMLLPLFSWLGTPTGSRLLTAVGAHLERRPRWILAPALVTSAWTASTPMEEGFAAWNRWAYLIFFALGYTVASDLRLSAALRRTAPVAAGLGAATFACALGLIMYQIESSGSDPLTADSAVGVSGRAFFGAAGWCSVASILGAAERLRQRPRRSAATRPPALRRWTAHAQQYLSEAALPLYVLHQPVVVAVAYWVVGWNSVPLAKFSAIVVLSLAATVTLYEVTVRHVPPARVLLGMR